MIAAKVRMHCIACDKPTAKDAELCRMCMVAAHSNDTEPMYWELPIESNAPTFRIVA